MKRFKTSKGFTLVEIIVVMSILTVLMGIGIYVYPRYKEQSFITEDSTHEKLAADEAINEYLTSGTFGDIEVITDDENYKAPEYMYWDAKNEIWADDTTGIKPYGKCTKLTHDHRNGILAGKMDKYNGELCLVMEWVDSNDEPITDKLCSNIKVNLPVTEDTLAMVSPPTPPVISEHIHNYSSEVTKEPTCIEDGIRTYTCYECGNSYTESIPALGHLYAKWEVYEHATYLADGEKRHYCTRSSCDAYDSTEKIPMYKLDGQTLVLAMSTMGSKLQASEFEVTTDTVSGIVASTDLSKRKNKEVMLYKDINNKLILKVPGTISVTGSLQNMLLSYKNLSSADLSNLNTSEVKNMVSMFESCGNLKSLNLGDAFSTENVTDMNSMFENCSELKSIDTTKFDTSKVTDMSHMFLTCRALTSIDVSNFDTANVKNMGAMFRDCESLTGLDVSNFNTKKVEKFTSMFQNCNKLAKLDLNNFDTANATAMHYMFSDCKNLQTLTFDKDKFKTDKVENMGFMFAYCSALQDLDVSGFDTSNVTKMNNMFNSCESLTKLDVSNFNTAEVLRMNFMFEGLNVKELDVSRFNTAKVVDMGGMFANCKNLESLNLSSFNTGNVRIMSVYDKNTYTGMFSSCTKLTELDLTTFDTSNVEFMAGMFRWCDNLKTIYVGSGWNTGKAAKLIQFKEYTDKNTDHIGSPITTGISGTKDMFSGCRTQSVIRR